MKGRKRTIQRSRRKSYRKTKTNRRSKRSRKTRTNRRSKRSRRRTNRRNTRRRGRRKRDLRGGSTYRLPKTSPKSSTAKLDPPPKLELRATTDNLGKELIKGHVLYDWDPEVVYDSDEYSPENGWGKFKEGEFVFVAREYEEDSSYWVVQSNNQPDGVPRNTGLISKEYIKILPEGYSEFEAELDLEVQKQEELLKLLRPDADQPAVKDRTSMKGPMSLLSSSPRVQGGATQSPVSD